MKTEQVSGYPLNPTMGEEMGKTLTAFHGYAHKHTLTGIQLKLSISDN